MSQHLEWPLPNYCVQNVAATCSSMTVQERLSFMASFIRCLLEAAQQVSEVVVPGEVPAGMGDADAGVSLVQTAATLQRVRLGFQEIQHSLDQCMDASGRRARLLHRRVVNRYYDMPATDIPSEVHALQAMLVVYMGEDAAERPDEMDIQWINRWWRTIVAGLDELDANAGLPLHPQSDEGPVDLDTPPNQLTEKEEYDYNQLQELQRGDDEELLKEVEKFEQEAAAARA